MKKDLHPKYDECSVTCVCGSTFMTRSTIKTINVEVCGACHPIYTGTQKIVDSTGRVERFEKLVNRKEAGTVRTKAQKRAEKSRKKIDAKNVMESNATETK
ncbi:50S ribosomal protein L31 [Patescibacteria group bacterium]|nr:50S ribosomal protein L31 [Patescibacteria group bacterium]